MLVLLDYFTLIIGLVISLIALRRILKSNYSVLHMCVLFFYVIQVLPLFVDFFGDLSIIERRTPYEYIAMTDTTVGLLYDVFCLISLIILLTLGNKYARKSHGFRNSEIILRPNKLVVFILSLLMFLPILGILLAPKPNYYSVFAYFQTRNYNDYSAPALYHKYVMLFIDYIAFFSIIAYYYLKSGTKLCTILVSIATCLLLWVDGKRGFLGMLIVSFILIDFIKKRAKSYNKLFIKSFFLTTVFVSYFIVYGMITEKHSDEPFYITYNGYFSRESEVKMAIYSRTLGENSMLPYDGATIVYNLFAYVPRIYWPDKPYGYYNYLTSFAHYGHGDTFLERSNFQVNIWSEYIANFGVFGYILSLFFILLVVKLSERSSNRALNMLGTVFVLTYMYLGFEMLVMLEFYLWFYLLIRSSITKKKKTKVRITG